MIHPVVQLIRHYYNDKKSWNKQIGCSQIVVVFHLERVRHVRCRHYSCVCALDLRFQARRQHDSAAISLLEKQVDTVIIDCRLGNRNPRHRGYRTDISETELFLLIVDGHVFRRLDETDGTLNLLLQQPARRTVSHDCKTSSARSSALLRA